MSNDTSLLNPFATRLIANDRAWAAALLESPQVAGDLSALADMWEIDVLRVVAVRPDGLEDFPELSLRIRGAFGRSLHAAEQYRTRSGRIMASAWDILAAPVGRDAKGDELPKPCIIRAWCEEDRLIVEMRLVGLASAWFDQAADALLAALENGLALVANGRQNEPIEILEVIPSRISGVALHPSVTLASLKFRTPFAVRQRDQIMDQPTSVIMSCVRRVEAMACWQGVSLQLPREELNSIIHHRLTFDANDAVIYRNIRHSVRQGHTPIPLRGLLGMLRCKGNGALGDVATVFALAETINAGSQAAIGLGWFDLAMA